MPQRAVRVCVSKRGIRLLEFMMFNQKGISPLIAAVLIIAFVIGLAWVVGPWIISFSKERALEVESQSETQVQCIYSGIDFTEDDIEYNLTGDPYPNSTVNITITNSNTQNLLFLYN